MKRFYSIWVMMLGALTASAQLTIDNAVNAADGVQNILLGAGVTVTNITFNGDNSQIGSFNCTGGCNLNIGYGIVMGSGNIDQTPANTTTSSSMGPASGFGATDPDLAELSGLSLNDAAVLQFDFESTGSTVAFNFVFGSDEYPEFVNAGFNDAFGFFLSGPGISGPYLNNAANIALIPNTTTPVTIDNVNSGLNSQYYVDNNGNVGNNNVIECDGFTTVLTAYAEVQCGETYHIKLAIADAGDTSYDSFVFLEAGSFESSELFSSFTSPSLSPPGGGMYEGCQEGYVNFIVPESNVDQIFNLEFTGNAQNGVDVSAIPTQILFPANETELEIPINALSDAVLEGIESLIITVAGATACGEDVTVEVIINDLPELEVVMPDVTINCGDQAVLTPQISGGLGNYLVEWETGFVGGTLSVYPSDPITYDFTVTDTCGVAPFDGVANVLFVDNPTLVVNIGPDLSITCLDEIDLLAAVSGGLGPYSYEWTANGFIASTDDFLNFLDNEDIEIEITVTDACDEIATDLLQVTYPPVPVIVDLGTDLEVTCLDVSTLIPDVNGGVGSYYYSWSDQDSNLGTASTLNYQTEETTTVVVDVEDECGNTSSDAITIVVPAESIILDIGQDYSTTCLDETLIAPDVTGGIGTLSYTWTLDGSVIGTGSSVNVQADDDAVLELVIEDQCGNTTNDQLNVSIPPVPVSVTAGSDLVVTCLDVSQLQASASGGVGNYSFQWSDSDGAIGTTIGINYQAVQQETITVEVTDECGNTSQDQLIISVPPVPISIVVSNDTTICVGETVQLTSQAEGGVGELSYQWSASQQSSVNYLQLYPSASEMVDVTAEDECGNSATASVFVNVIDIQPAFTANYLNDNTVEFVNNTENASSILWIFSDGDTSTENNPIHEFATADEWSATLIVIAQEGCQKMISQDYAPLGELFVPNCFTPDNDGINDFLFAVGHDIKSFEWWIYNRWGELIYTSKDMQMPWDGSFNKGEYYVPDGVYTYRIKAIGERDNIIEKTGSVLIMR